MCHAQISQRQVTFITVRAVCSALCNVHCALCIVICALPSVICALCTAVLTVYTVCGAHKHPPYESGEMLHRLRQIEMRRQRWRPNWAAAKWRRSEGPDKGRALSDISQALLTSCHLG